MYGYAKVKNEHATFEILLVLSYIFNSGLEGHKTKIYERFSTLRIALRTLTRWPI